MDPRVRQGPGSQKRKGPGISAKEKWRKKREFLENKENVYKLVFPTIGALIIIICLVVYLFTRPKQ